MIPIVKTPDYDAKLDEVWSYLSTFFNFFDEKKDFEAMWDGVRKIYAEILRRTYNASLAVSPNTSYTDGSFNFIQLDFSISNALPVYLDPTDISLGYLCTPESVEKLPTTIDENRKNVPAVRIFSKSIAHYGSSLNLNESIYVVIKKFDGSVKYGKMRSINPDPTLTALTGGTNFEFTGVEYDDIADSKFNFYITKARSFRVDSLLKKIDQLVSCINEPTSGLVLNIDADYEFEDSIIKFNTDILGSYGPDFTLFIPNGEIILDDIYNNFGWLIGIKNWSTYKWSNEDGRGCFMAIMRGYYLAGNPEIMRSALCALHGISIANRDSTVVGLFESYEYNIINVEVVGGLSYIYLAEDLNPLFSAGDGYIPRACIINKDDLLVNVLSADNAQRRITVNSISGVSAGDKLCIELINSFRFNKIIVDVDRLKYALSIDGQLNINTSNNPAFLQYLMDYVDQAGIYTIMPGEEFNPLSRPHQYPRMVVDSSRFSGVFHLSAAPTDTMITRFVTMAPAGGDFHEDSSNYPYNDIIVPITDENSEIKIQGRVRLYWPTHKFLLLDGATQITPYEEPGETNLVRRKQKIYIESTMDTPYVKGDTVKALSCVIENIDVLTSITFPNWTEFSGFRKSPNIDLQTGYVNACKYVGEYDFGSYIQEKVPIDIVNIYPVYGKNDRLTVELSAMSVEQLAAWNESDLGYISFNYIADGLGKKYSAHILSFERSPVNNVDNMFTVYVDRNIPEGVFYDVAAIEGSSGQTGIQYTAGSQDAIVLGDLSSSGTIIAGDILVIHNPNESLQSKIMTANIVSMSIDLEGVVTLHLDTVPDFVLPSGTAILNTTHTNVYSVLGAIPFVAAYKSNRARIEKPGFEFKLFRSPDLFDTGEYLNGNQVKKVSSLYFKINNTFESGILEHIKNNPGAHLWIFDSTGNLSVKINPMEIQIIELARAEQSSVNEMCVKITGEFRSLIECFTNNSSPILVGDTLKVSIVFTSVFNFSGINNLIRGVRFSEDPILSEADVVSSRKNIYSSLISGYSEDAKNVSTKQYNNYLDSDFQFICDFLHKHRGNYSTNKHSAFIVFSGNTMSEIIDTENLGEYPITPSQLMTSNSAPYLEQIAPAKTRVVYPKANYELSDNQYEVIASEYTGYDWIGLVLMAGAVLQSEANGDMQVNGGRVTIKHNYGFKPVFQCVFCDVGDKDQAQNGDGLKNDRLGKMNMFEPDSVEVTSGQCAVSFSPNDNDFGGWAFRDIFFYIPHDDAVYREHITDPTVPQFIEPLNFTEFLRNPETGEEEFYDNAAAGAKRMTITSELYPFRAYTPSLEEIVSDAIYFRKSLYINNDRATKYSPPRFMPVWNYNFRLSGSTSTVYLNRGYMKNRYTDSSIFVHHSRSRDRLQMIDFFEEISQFDPRRVDIEPYIMWDPIHEWCARRVDVNNSVYYAPYSGDRKVKSDSHTGYYDPTNRHESPPEAKREGLSSYIGDERHLIYCLYRLDLQDVSNLIGKKLLAVNFMCSRPLDVNTGKLVGVPGVLPTSTLINAYTRMYDISSSMANFVDICVDDLVIDKDADPYRAKYWRVKRIDRDRGQLFIEMCLPVIHPDRMDNTAPDMSNVMIMGCESRVQKNSLAEAEFMSLESANSQGYILGRIVSIQEVGSHNYVYLWADGTEKVLLDTLEYIANGSGHNMSLRFFTVDGASGEDSVDMNMGDDACIAPPIGTDIMTVIPLDNQDELVKSMSTITKLSGEGFNWTTYGDNSLYGSHVTGKHVFINNKTYRISSSYLSPYQGIYNVTNGMITMLLCRKNFFDGGEYEIGIGDSNRHHVKLKNDLKSISRHGSDFVFDVTNIKNIKMLSLDTAGEEYASKAEFYYLAPNGFNVHDCGKYLISKSDEADYIGLGARDYDDTIKRIANSLDSDYGDLMNNPDDPDDIITGYTSQTQLNPHIVYAGTDDKGVFIGKSEEDLFCHMNVGKLKVIGSSATNATVEITDSPALSTVRPDRLQLTNCSKFNSAWIRHGKMFIGGTTDYLNLDDRQFVVESITNPEGSAKEAVVKSEGFLPLPVALMPPSGAIDIIWDRLSSTFGAKCYLGQWPSECNRYEISVQLNHQNIAVARGTSNTLNKNGSAGYAIDPMTGSFSGSTTVFTPAIGERGRIILSNPVGYQGFLAYAYINPTTLGPVYNGYIPGGRGDYDCVFDYVRGEDGITVLTYVSGNTESLISSGSSDGIISFNARLDTGFPAPPFDPGAPYSDDFGLVALSKNPSSGMYVNSGGCDWSATYEIGVGDSVLMAIKIIGMTQLGPKVLYVLNHNNTWFITDTDLIMDPLLVDQANPLEWLYANRNTDFTTVDVDVNTQTGVVSMVIEVQEPSLGTFYFSGQTQLFAYFDYYENTAVVKTPVESLSHNGTPVTKITADYTPFYYGDFMITTKYSMSSAYRNYLAHKYASLNVSDEEPADMTMEPGQKLWFNNKNLLSLIGGMSDYQFGQGEIYEKFRLERVVGYQPINSRMIPGSIQVDYLGRNITRPADISVLGDFSKNIIFERDNFQDLGNYSQKQFGFYDDERDANYDFSTVRGQYSIHDMLRKIDIENASYNPDLPCRYLIEYAKGEPGKTVISTGLAFWTYDRNKPQPYNEYETPMYLFKLNLETLKFDYNSLFVTSDAIPQSKSFMDFYVRGAGTKFLEPNGEWIDNTGLVMYIWDFESSKWFSYYGYDMSGKAIPRNTSDPTYLINNVLVKR